MHGSGEEGGSAYALGVGGGHCVLFCLFCTLYTLDSGCGAGEKCIRVNKGGGRREGEVGSRSKVLRYDSGLSRGDRRRVGRSRKVGRVGGLEERGEEGVIYYCIVHVIFILSFLQ